MLPTMDDPQPAEDEERALAALAELRRALDAASAEDRALALDLINDLARRFDRGRSA